jgi:glycosyltransferase involved in cell wall biosynthesis
MIEFLIMLKNEETSIMASLNSIKKYAKHLFILDTGSTDRTMEIIEKFCEKFNINLHIKKTNFVNFAITRNESIDFAEEICKKNNIKYLTLLDAGDEFKCSTNKDILYNIIEQNFSKNNSCYGAIKKVWLVNKEEIIHHDIRFIKVGYNCRYDERYPVHETFKNKTNKNTIFLGDLIILYQNRNLYGFSTQSRLERDLEMLKNAEQNNRNMYYLGQTYSSLNDFDNSIQTYKKCLEKINKDDYRYKIGDDISEFEILKSLITVYFTIKDYDNVYHYVELMITKKYNDGYMYLLKYCVESKNYRAIEKYLTQIVNFKCNNITTINSDDYNYKRWHLLSLVCIEIRNLKYARMACEKAIGAKNSDIDKRNLMIIEILEKQK